MMNVLIFDGSNEEDEIFSSITRTISELGLKYEHQVHILDLKAMDISPCRGCFNCWIKTPGVCVINDDGRDMVKRISQSDLSIYITPVSFGSYSHTLKRSLDRSIPFLLPFFKKIHGEIHHRKRYAKCPSMLVIGVLENHDQQTEDIFRNLVSRNAINFHAPEHSVHFIINKPDGNLIDGELLLFLEERFK